ncbi:MAG: MBOAT family protein [Clostridia bacterium]|nr:MBOAT family protein [Clostridia bacterium]
MLFSSIGFLYVFLPITLAVYFIVPFRFKNFVLLIASLAFYFYGEPIYTLLMLGTCVSAYIHGLLIHACRRNKASKVFLISSIIVGVSALGFFKYSDFFISNINNFFGADFSLLGLALPIGISFYTFQTLSYTIDVYRGDAPVQKSFIRLATYVALFPQLIAGPIVRYSTVANELSHRTHSFENFSYGVNRFVIGIAKKVIIADTLGAFASSFHTMSEPSVCGMWLYAICISLQIYFDFSGYSDMAIGLGRMFGFHFCENFNYPYISKSIAEFWRRWHMSLGSWFRDYVYIPMGGNRVSLPRWCFNILTVWFLTGFWHGADWTFILWGLYFAVFLTAEKFFLNRLFAKIPSIFSRLYVITTIVISFVIFSGDGISGAFGDLYVMFGGGNNPIWNSETAYYLGGSAFILAVGIIGAAPVAKNILHRLKANEKVNKIINVSEPVFHAAILLTVTAYFVDGSFSPFLYFRF